MIINTNKQPCDQIYAFMDDSCKDKGLESVPSNAEAGMQLCTTVSVEMFRPDVMRLTRVKGHKCLEGKNMGGSMAISSRWYNIVAPKRSDNPYCQRIPSVTGC